MHIYFETVRSDGTWALTFGRQPDTYWLDELTFDKVEDGSALTIFGPPTEDEIHSAIQYLNDPESNFHATEEMAIEHVLKTKLHDHFRSASTEELAQRYQDDAFFWSYQPREHMQRAYFRCLHVRDGRWFDFLIGNSKAGVPTDICTEVTEALGRYGSDGHMHHWCGVADILNKRPIELPTVETALNHLSNLITDPEHTRMVFFFDN